MWNRINKRVVIGGIVTTTTAIATIQYNRYYTPHHTLSCASSSPGSTRSSSSVSDEVVSCSTGLVKASADTAASYIPTTFDLPAPFPTNLPVTRAIPAPPSDMTPQLLIFITRHGHRTPVGRLPHQTKQEFRDMWGMCSKIDHSMIPCGRVGEFQLHSVGAQIRQLYVHQLGFLPKVFDPQLFRLRSTNLSRTQLSLIRMMEGLYPELSSSPEKIQQDIVVWDPKDENMYPNHYICERLKEIYMEASHDERYVSLSSSPSATITRSLFSTAYNTPPKDLGTWIVIGDTLKCIDGAQEAQQILPAACSQSNTSDKPSVSLPPGVFPHMKNEGKYLSEALFAHILRGGAKNTHSLQTPSCKMSAELLYTDKEPIEQETIRLGMGRFLRELFDAIHNIKNNIENIEIEKKEGQYHGGIVLDAIAEKKSARILPKALFYSGHDTTVAPLINALHTSYAYTYNSWPPFASNVIVELLEKKPVRKIEKPILSDTTAPLPPHLLDQESNSSSSNHNRSKKSANTSSTTTTTTDNNTSATNPSSEWYVRLLVDHREISLLPLSSYDTLLHTYVPHDFVQECKQKGDKILGPHQW